MLKMSSVSLRVLSEFLFIAQGSFVDSACYTWLNNDV